MLTVGGPGGFTKTPATRSPESENVGTATENRRPKDTTLALGMSKMPPAFAAATALKCHTQSLQENHYAKQSLG